MKCSKWFYFILGTLYFLPFVYYLGSVIIDFDIPSHFVRRLTMTIIPIILGVIYFLLGFAKLQKNKFSDWSVIIGLIGFVVISVFFATLASSDSGFAAIGAAAIFGLPIITLMGTSVILLLIGLFDKK